MKKKRKLFCIILLITGFAVLLWIGFCGYQWGWGPFLKLHDIKTSRLSGNANMYDLDEVKEQEHTILTGKKIGFLGSSVTYGASSMGTSFVEYLGKRDGTCNTKSAVSGTTLVDSGAKSYIRRLKKMDKNEKFDLFVCQLSTNDATQKKPLGEVGTSKDLNSFDTKTVSGAVEYITAYVKDTWNCPVVFFTNPKYDSSYYGDMVNLLLKIKAKWDIGVIDMWNAADFNQLSEKDRALYMADQIHPTRAGYLLWWTPFFENYLIQYMENTAK